MENDLSRLLQKSLLQVENSLRRFLNLLPGMAYRCVVENNYEYRLAVMFLLAAGAALLFARFSTQIYLVALCGFLLSVFNMAGGFILFSYTAESYPTHMRNTATGTHNGLARLSVSAFQYAIPVILASFGGTVGLVNYDIPAIFTTFTTCAALFILPVPFVLMFGRRTGGKSLEDIA